MSIYITLTTVPERLAVWNTFKRNLESLLNQATDKDYKVILNLPFTYRAKNIPYILPDELVQLAKDNSKLIINRLTTDRGPIEKLIGCFNIVQDPEDIIITLDDDHVYYDDMIEYILKKIEQYPYSAVGFRGDVIIEKREFIQNGIKKYALLGTHAYFPLKQDVHAAVPGHWHSVTYRRKFFTDDFLSDKYLNVAASDDFIVSYYLRDKKIDYVMVAWDKETNFIPVNYSVAGMGRSSHHYPILEQLNFPGDSGFSYFRKQTNDHNGFLKDDVTKSWNFNCDNWYYEPPFTAADEPAPATPVTTYNNTTYPDGDVVPENVDIDNFIYPTITPIITLTTIPSRLKAEYDAGIKSCISSLISQKYPGEYKIHFNIPYKLNSTGEEYIIPQWLTDITIANPNFQIFRTDDIGPLTKLWPTMQRTSDSETIIVVCDDDLVYHEYMLKEQVINQSKFPKSAVGYDGLTCWVPIYSDVRDHYITAIRKHVNVKVLQHYKTISYKRKYLGDDFVSFMNDYYEWNDDVLMSAYLGKNNIKRVSTYSEKYTPDYKSLQEWTSGNAACTFPVLRHTSHEGEEGCTIHRMANRPHFKNNPYTPDLIEKYIK